MTNIAARFAINWPGFSLDVDLELPATGVTALFGESGSGKTTLLRCLAGLERATHGYLRINNKVWQDGQYFLPTHKRPIGYVFQEASLFTHLSVLGNLRYGMQRAGFTESSALDHAVELLGIKHLLDREPANLSGGEKQRVAIARALAVNPQVLLMDEPLASLDLPRRREILPFLERLHRELSIPIIYVSHAPDEVARLADHLVVLEQGKVIASGALADTLTRLDLPIRLGEDTGAIVEARISAIDAQWHLARADFSGGSVWLLNHNLQLDQAVRIRILARDISVARTQPADSSIQNSLRGVVEAIGDDEHQGLALLRLRVKNTVLLARLTKRAVADLNLTSGESIWLQVKSVALME